MNSQIQKKALVTISIFISGILWYFANHPGGNFGYLMWLAPVAVILIAPNTSGRISFFVAFVSYLIGRMSWFGYLVTVATIIPAVILTILLPLIFALIVLITREMIIKTNSWYSVFAYPVFFTAYEWLLITFSSDGTAASIAYSQSNFIPLIQIASITGILGITFMVTFIPSAIAVSLHYRKKVNELKPLISLTIILTVLVLLFGIIRISHKNDEHKVMAGLAVLDEKLHDQSMKPDLQTSLHTAETYAQEIGILTSKGARIIVFPEKGINLSKESDSSVIELLKRAALQNHVTVVVGYSNFKTANTRNSSIVINDEGLVAEDYDKIHLVTGFEDQFMKGSKIGLFKFSGIQAGTAICKDLDFPTDIRKYGKSKASILCIPAWDFVVDDWLHSRMAILRGVENGFSEIRTARLGRLSISDPYGKVNAEANCINRKTTSLVGLVSLERIDTIYTKYGDWFGLIVIFTAIAFLLLIVFKKKGINLHNIHRSDS